jgi:hypothetical protein
MLSRNEACMSDEAWQLQCACRHMGVLPALHCLGCASIVQVDLNCLDISMRLDLFTSKCVFCRTLRMRDGIFRISLTTGEHPLLRYVLACICVAYGGES